MKVLITGSSGNIGSKLVGLLGEDFELAGLDRVPPRPRGGVAGYVVADVHEVDDLRSVCWPDMMPLFTWRAIRPSRPRGRTCSATTSP